ncbi:MAG TPA: hypothetical protein VFS20_04100 [Longimicrobium sp.]|nr:hypothetical protein [Longimicrobium sp.]
MTSDAIFLLEDDGRLEKVPFGTYVLEDHLQELVARFPELLPGDQIAPDDPLRWLLVCREAGVPDGESAGDRWSLDHLLLDHRAIPTFVEVKRSSDTRIRREVVGQMLDYAANATRYWPVDRIRAIATAQAGGPDQLDERIRTLLQLKPDDDAGDVEAYWAAVEENLRNGVMRLLFVGDELPRELRRLIEFLNEHMPSIEVLGVELRQYSGSRVRALVPRVIGQTQRALDVRSGSRNEPRRKTTEPEFLQACPEWSRAFFQRLLSEARGRGLLVAWGTKGFSVRAAGDGGQPVSVLYGYPPGAMASESPSLEIYLKYLDVGLADRLRAELLAVGGFVARGQYTILLPLAVENLPQAEAGLARIWNVYEMIGRTGGMDDQAGQTTTAGTLP